MRTVSTRSSARDWMSEAACGRYPEAPWTGVHERKPEPSVMAVLAGVCGHCPVRRQCARYALQERCDCGVYAGIWLPKHGWDADRRSTGTGPWHQARDALSRLI